MQAALGRLVCTALTAWLLCVAVSPKVLAEGGTLRRAISTLPSSFDPQTQSQSAQRQVLNDIFTGLTELDQTGNVAPGAAHDWEISEDGKIYIFHLRPDGRWQDGTPVTAHDFALAFTRLFSLGNKARQSNLFADIAGSASLAGTGLPIDPAALPALNPSVEAQDDLTLKIVLNRPFPDFLFVLSKPPAFPVPTHLYHRLGEAWAHPDTLIGNGAYQPVAFTKDQHIRLRKSAHFHGSNDKMADEVIHVAIPETATVGRFMAAGHADLSSQIPNYQMSAVRSLPGFSLMSQPRTSLTSILFNTRIEKLASADVRKALYLAADRLALIRTLNADYTAVFGLVPPLEGYSGFPAISVDRDTLIEEAKALMTQEGYSPTRTLDLTLKIPNRITSQALAAQLRRDWAHIFVNLTIEQLPFGELTRKMGVGDFELIRRSWVADYPDPYNFLQLYTPQFNATLTPTLDPVLENLFTLANQTPAKRYDFLAQAEKHMLASYPAVPLFMRSSNFLVSEKLKGWSPAPWAPNASRWLWLVK